MAKTTRDARKRNITRRATWQRVWNSKRRGSRAWVQRLD